MVQSILRKSTLLAHKLETLLVLLNSGQSVVVVPMLLTQLLMEQTTQLGIGLNKQQQQWMDLMTHILGQNLVTQQ